MSSSKNMDEIIIDGALHESSKESFDAALLPGVREQMADVYRSLRQSETNILQSVLDSDGAFQEGIAHTRNCPLCGATSNSASLVYYTHGMHIIQCMNCSLVYSRDVINHDADSARYRHSNVMGAHLALHSNNVYAELERKKARYIVSRMRQIKTEDNVNLLDIGCSTGAVLAAGQDVGWRAVGIDLNSDTVNLARARGLNAVVGSFPNDLPDSAGTFEAITMLDVLEHVEEPVDFLACVTGRLSQDGLLAIQVPNFNSLLIRIEGPANNNICHGHWSYFTDETLCKVAAQAGLKPLMIETFISEVDRIRAYPETQIIETARSLSDVDVEIGQITHQWIHKYHLGYKLFGVFVRA